LVWPVGRGLGPKWDPGHIALFDEKAKKGATQGLEYALRAL